MSIFWATDLTVFYTKKKNKINISTHKSLTELCMVVINRSVVKDLDKRIELHENFQRNFCKEFNKFYPVVVCEKKNIKKCIKESEKTWVYDLNKENKNSTRLLTAETWCSTHALKTSNCKKKKRRAMLIRHHVAWKLSM